jgi:hypothetical protein
MTRRTAKASVTNNSPLSEQQQIAADLKANLLTNPTLLEFYAPRKDYPRPQLGRGANADVDPSTGLTDDEADIRNKQREQLSTYMVVTALQDDEGEYSPDHFVVMLMNLHHEAKKVEALEGTIKSHMGLFSIEVDDDGNGATTSFICHKTMPEYRDTLLEGSFGTEFFDRYRVGGVE